MLSDGKSLVEYARFSTKQLFKKGIIKAYDFFNDCTHSWKTWLRLKIKIKKKIVSLGLTGPSSSEFGT